MSYGLEGNAPALHVWRITERPSRDRVVSTCQLCGMRRILSATGQLVTGPDGWSEPCPETIVTRAEWDARVARRFSA